MGSLLVVIAVTALVVVWVRGTRKNRLQWLSRLDLPGAWEREGEPGRLELSGSLDQGRFRISDGQGKADRTGNWCLEGNTLIFTDESGTRSECELRLFQEGKIGIDGPTLERRVYQKVPSNVVPLRGRG